MSEEEYKQFLRYVFHEYVQERTARKLDYFDGPMGHHTNYELERLRRATRILRAMGEFSDSEGNISSDFTTEGLRRIINDVENGVRSNNRILKYSGFMDALDAHYEELVDGLRFEHLPEKEVELLRSFGITDPQLELRGQIYLLRARRSRRERNSNELAVSQRLERVEKELSEARNDLAQQSENQELQKAPAKSRRWFKGLGQIGQGAALSICDVGLIAGAFLFPVSEETKTWGAVASVTTGVGMIFTGIGEFRGE